MSTALWGVTLVVALVLAAGAAVWLHDQRTLTWEFQVPDPHGSVAAWLYGNGGATRSASTDDTTDEETTVMVLTVVASGPRGELLDFRDDLAAHAQVPTVAVVIRPIPRTKDPA